LFLGLLVFITALCISAVAIYYSIAGLVAIFAAAAIPIMIMGGALEVGKLVTAVWLHKHWRRAKWWLRYYLALAVVVLMFITSMGIFGFLSKAHIEQTSASIESVEQVARIETELARQQAIIDRAEIKIREAENSTGNRNDDINAQIEKEQQRIDSAYERIKPAIEEQQKIISDARDSDADRTKPYEDQLTKITDELVRLDNNAKEYEATIADLDVDNSAIDPIQAQIATIKNTIAKVEGQIASGESEQIKQAQLTIGSNADGQAGPNTRRSANTWIGLQKERISELQEQISQLRIEAKTTVDNERTRLSTIVSDIRNVQIPALKDREVQMLAKIDEVRATESPIVTTARDEIARIRASADEQVNASQTLIQQLREKITVDSGADIDAIIDAQSLRITDANKLIDELTEEKYTIEAEYRKLEAEVGPIKYIAEFIYEEADRDILEQAVRWVIITIIFVFDPLAVLLLIASQYTFEWRSQNDNQIRRTIVQNEPDPEPQSTTEPEEPVYEDVDQEIIDNEFAEEKVEDEDELKFMLEKADPEVLEEVAKELEIEKPVDKEPYDPYTDNRADEELTNDELAQRQNRKLYSPDGRLAAMPKRIKSIKIKSIAEKAEDNKKEDD
tara:strand:+ start:7560 stop:9419 length:1860 start_codon:yes stop_codon:yes gene_type:complete